MSSNVKIYITEGGGSPCGCGVSPCGCNQQVVVCQPCTPTPPVNNSPVGNCNGECIDLMDFKCVIYNGAAIPSIGVTTASTLLTIIGQLGTAIAALQTANTTLAARVTALENA